MSIYTEFNYNIDNFLSIVTKTNKYYSSFKFQYQSITKVFKKFIRIISQASNKHKVSQERMC